MFHGTVTKVIPGIRYSFHKLLLTKKTFDAIIQIYQLIRPGTVEYSGITSLLGLVWFPTY